LVRFKDDKVKRLDLRALSQSLISAASERIAGISCFSAYADWVPGPMSRYQECVKASEVVGVDCMLGHLKDRHGIATYA
jgi:hypothetical protein